VISQPPITPRFRALAALVAGTMRMPAQHFSVYLGRVGSHRLTRVRCPSTSYYADPFVWKHEAGTWLFVEEFRYLCNKGRLVALQVNDDLSTGPAVPVDIGVESHLSFPFLFERRGALYMVPETSADRAVHLFRCHSFPNRWARVGTLLRDVNAADTVLFEHENLWWLITSVRSKENGWNRGLAIFSAPDPLHSAWTPHPVNSEGWYHASIHASGRNAGPPVPLETGWLRPVQVNRRYYGEQLGFMQVVQLSPQQFAERPYEGKHVLQDLAQSRAIHHVSMCGDIIACDARDRIGLLQYLPGSPRRLRPTRHGCRPADLHVLVADRDRGAITTW
jgi:hypothetical protein